MCLVSLQVRNEGPESKIASCNMAIAVGRQSNSGYGNERSSHGTRKSRHAVLVGPRHLTAHRCWNAWTSLMPRHPTTRTLSSSPRSRSRRQFLLPQPSSLDAMPMPMPIPLLMMSSRILQGEVSSVALHGPVTVRGVSEDPRASSVSACQCLMSGQMLEDLSSGLGCASM